MSAQPEVDDDPVSPDDEFFFQGLGGCQEVGRSCHIIRYKGKTIMVSPPQASSIPVMLSVLSSMLACTLAEKARLPCPISTLTPSAKSTFS